MALLHVQVHMVCALCVGKTGMYEILAVDHPLRIVLSSGN